MLELKDICVSFRSERQDRVFGHTRQQVLFDVSLSVKKGTCLGILGDVYKRQEYMMRRADYVVAVYDDPTHYNGMETTIRFVEKRNLSIVLIHPDTGIIKELFR